MEIFESVSTIIGAIGLVILTVIIIPFILFWCAYAGGWIAMVAIGNPLCHALNTTFGTTRFVPEMIPWIAAACGWIGGYFKTTVRTTKEK